jgi:hypothetical protein
MSLAKYKTDEERGLDFTDLNKVPDSPKAAETVNP